MRFDVTQGYRTRQLAEMLGLSHETILREISRERLRATKFGPRKWRIAPEAVEEWLETCGAPVERKQQGRPRVSDQLAREFAEFRASRAA